VVGTIYVHDGRPDRPRTELDEHGFGPLFVACRARRRLDIGDQVRLTDGTTWCVLRCRTWFEGRHWRQAVQIGAALSTASSPRPPAVSLRRPFLAAG
jgi:hypothetical protein